MNWTFALIVTLAVCLYWTAMRWWCGYIVRRWFYKRWAFALYFWTSTLAGLVVIEILFLLFKVMQ